MATPLFFWPETAVANRTRKHGRRTQRWLAGFAALIAACGGATAEAPTQPPAVAAAAGPTATATPAPTPAHTATAAPTAGPTPTSTPEPLSTAPPETSPTPTVAPTPTATSEPPAAPRPTGPRVEALIRAAGGGRLQLGPEDAPRIVVEILPNALAEDTTISIQELSLGDLPDEVTALEPVGRGYRLGPDGLQLAAPATVTLALDAEEVAGLDLASGVPAFLGLLLSSDRTIDFLRNTVTTADLATGSVTLTGETAHFTDAVTISGPLMAKLEPPKVGPLRVGESWPAKVTLTNLGEGAVDVDSVKYFADGSVESVGPDSADEFLLSTGKSHPTDPAPRFACRTANMGTYGVSIDWAEAEYSSHVVGALVQGGWFIPSGVLAHRPRGAFVLSGVADCDKKSGVALECSTGVPLADTPLPPQLVVDIQMQAGSGEMEGTFIVKMTFPVIPDLAALDGWPPSGSLGVRDPGFPAGPEVQGWVFNSPVNLSLDWWGNPEGQYQVVVLDSREPGIWQYNDALGEAVTIEQTGNMVTMRIPKSAIPGGATWYSVVTNVLSGEQPCIGVADGLDAESGQPIYEFPPR